MYRRSERCDDIVLAGHKLLFKLVRLWKMPLFEKGNGREAIEDGDSGLVDGSQNQILVLEKSAIVGRGCMLIQ